ncbi:MAG: acyltransferase family protein [Planctomycetaceae bacterium]
MTTVANGDPLTEPVRQRPRYHGLDALRAWAMFLGIVLHAGLAYMTSSDRVFWGIVDPSQDETLTTFVLWVHSFRMELFFMISGFFSCMVLQYRDNQYFIRQRVKKLLVPFICWWPAIMVSIEASQVFHEWTYYGLGDGNGYWSELYGSLTSSEYWSRYVPTPEGDNRGTAHLWFIYYLMMFVATNAAMVAIRWPKPLQNLWKRLVQAADWVLAHPLRIVLPAIVMIPLVAIPKWYTTYEGPFSLRPVFRYYTYFGCTYLAGYLVYSNLHHLETLKKHWKWYALISLVAWPGIMVRDYIHPHFIMDTQEGARNGFALGMTKPATEFATANQQFIFPPVNAFADGPASIAVAESLLWIPPLAVSVVMLSTSLSLFGVALKYFNRPSDRVRYWSDSAYFLYVLHLPLTMLLPSLMLSLPWHGLVKFAIATVATTGLSLVLYETCVRYTFIGTQMNGPRSKPGKQSASGSATT